MQTLDVEQQLRLQEAQWKHSGTPQTAAHAPFITQHGFEVVAQPAIVILGSVALVASILLLVVLTNRALRGRLASGITRAQAPLFSTFFGAPVYSCFMAAWMILVAVSATLHLMEKASLGASEGEHHRALASVTSYRFLALPAGLFLCECLGILALWLYPLGRSTYTMDAGVVAALLVFFPSLYQSLVLDSNVPERLFVWVTHSIFFTSLFVLCTVSAPWLRREYREVMRELRNHTKAALYADRREPRELRARREARNKRR